MKDKLFLDIFWLSNKEFKVHDTFSGSVFVSKDRGPVYKVFDDVGFFKRELLYYTIFKKEGIMTPVFDDVSRRGLNVLKLENIRWFSKRSENFKKLWLDNIAALLKEIHSIDVNRYFKEAQVGSSFLLRDIHPSNFFVSASGELWVFDFSSSWLWEREEDLAWMLIELELDEKLFSNFLKTYTLAVDMSKIYRFAISILEKRILAWTGIWDKIPKYKSFLSELKQKL